MDRYDKAALAAETDQAVMILRTEPLSVIQAAGAVVIAETLAAEFPGVPDLGRVLVALTQVLAPLGAASCQHLASIVIVIGAAGIRLVPEEQVPRA